MRIKNCRNCKSKNLINIFSLGNIHFTGKFLKKKQTPKKGDINVVLCKKCELVQLNNNFDLKYMYGKDYGYKTGVNATMRKHVFSVVKKLKKITNISAGDHVLDIASNDGTLLNYYNKNIITFGIDPTIIKFRKEYKNINYKIPKFFSKNLIKKKIKNKKFKIITALSVFYDLLDPNKFLKDAEDLLDINGVLLLEFADLASIVKYNMFDTFCHEHLEYYSFKVIKDMCTKNNLRIFDVSLNHINGGSIQFFICKENATFRSNFTFINSVEKRDFNLKLSRKKTYVKFMTRVKKIKKNLLSLLEKAKKNNNIIHAYGASTKGNVLLQYFGIDNNIISNVAERNEKKYNLFTPGSKIKIISENESRKMKPKYYLVLPWHFKNEILKRERKLIKKGTNFIFPLPKVSINS
jgi:2-polyprenyl-3-methyl-5-hydroxy-6-metoxy-1,4-benzoquinol methylase